MEEAAGITDHAWDFGGTAGLTRLEFASKRFKHDVTDQRRHDSDHKIDRRKNVGDSPSQAHFPPLTRPFEFAHQKVGIEQEDYKAYLDYCSPDGLLHTLGV